MGVAAACSTAALRSAISSAVRPSSASSSRLIRRSRGFRVFSRVLDGRHAQRNQLRRAAVQRVLQPPDQAQRGV